MPPAMTEAMMPELTACPVALMSEPSQDVGCLVDRTAKVDRHHAAQDETEDDAARRGHAVEAVEQPGIKDSRRRIDNKGHDKADENQT